MEDASTDRAGFIFCQLRSNFPVDSGVIAGAEFSCGLLGCFGFMKSCLCLLFDLVKRIVRFLETFLLLCVILLSRSQLLPQLAQILVEGPLCLILANFRLKGRNRRCGFMGLLCILGVLTFLLDIRQQRLLSFPCLETADIFRFRLFVIRDNCPQSLCTFRFFILRPLNTTFLLYLTEMSISCCRR